MPSLFQARAERQLVVAEQHLIEAVHRMQEARSGRIHAGDDNNDAGANGGNRIESVYEDDEEFAGIAAQDARSRVGSNAGATVKFEFSTTFALGLANKMLYNPLTSQLNTLQGVHLTTTTI